MKNLESDNREFYICVFDYEFNYSFVGVFESIEKVKEVLPNIYREYTFKEDNGLEITVLGSYYLYKVKLNTATNYA